MKNTILLLSTIFFAAACSSSGGNDGESTSSRTVLLNGKTPEKYYEQFLDVKIGSCEEGNLYFKFVSLDSPVISQVENKTYRLGGEIFLHSDQTYTFVYEERRVVKNGGAITTKGYSYNVEYREKVKGRWKVNGINLELEDLGVANAIQLNGYDQILITFHRNMNLEGLKGLSVFGTYVDSTYGLQSFNEYCGYED